MLTVIISAALCASGEPRDMTKKVHPSKRNKAQGNKMVHEGKKLAKQARKPALSARDRKMRLKQGKAAAKKLLKGTARRNTRD